MCLRPTGQFWGVSTICRSIFLGEPFYDLHINLFWGLSTIYVSTVGDPFTIYRLIFLNCLRSAGQFLRPSGVYRSILECVHSLLVKFGVSLLDI